MVYLKQDVFFVPRVLFPLHGVCQSFAFHSTLHLEASLRRAPGEIKPDIKFPPKNVGTKFNRASAPSRKSPRPQARSIQYLYSMK